MAEQIPFIGREALLNHVFGYIEDWGVHHTVCIEAPGGIGKTRVIEEIAKWCCSQIDEGSSLIISDVIDFDDPGLRSSKNMGHHIARSLGEENFEAYFQAQREYQKMQLANISPDELARERLNINKTFADCINMISEKTRVILFYDTTDYIEEGKGLWKNFAEVGSQLKNVVQILAGRNSKRIGTYLQKQEVSHVHLIELHPFTDEESQQYLEHKQQQRLITIPPDIARQLIVLSEGKPILIDLATEWLARRIPLEWMLEESLSTLKSQKRREEFERQLVQRIAQVRKPIHRLILILSHIHPLNVEMLEHFMQKFKPKALFEEAKAYIFIKPLPGGYITLHDEMRRMISKYILPEDDPHSLRQLRHYSKLAAAYFKKKVSELDAHIKEVQLKKQGHDEQFELRDFLRQEEFIKTRVTLLLQQLEHTLFLDIDQGFSLFKEITEEARRAYQSRFAESVCKTAEQFTDQFNSDQRYTFEMLRGRVLYDLGFAKTARELFQRLLDANQENLERKAEIYNALGASEIHLGELDRALQYQKESLYIFNKLEKKEFVPNLANMIGRIHRMLGNWTRSIQYYEIALKEADNIHATPDTIAEIKNNLSYVLALEGDLDKAIRYAKEALTTWEELEFTKKVGIAEMTLGAAYRYQGNYDQALTCHEKAVTHFKEPEDSEGLVRAHFHLGFTQWFKGDKTQNAVWYQFALESFERSLRLAEKYYHIKELPAILHESSHIYWSLGDKDKARQVNAEAYQKSKDVHDIHYAINSLLAMAEFDYADGKYENIPFYAKTLKKEFENKQYHFPLFYGRIRRILAEVAFERQEYETSLNYFSEGLTLIAQHGGYGVWGVQEELDLLKQRIQGLPPEMVPEWINRLRTYWKKQKPVEKYAVMLQWCDNQQSL